MSGFLLDTNVISEFNRRGEPDRRVKQWLEAADTDSLYISALTLGEIRFGVELLPPVSGERSWSNGLIGTCRNGLKDESCRSISPFADRWGSVRAQAQMNGRPLSVIDALLAATALHHHLTIVSRNVNDFSVAGLAVVNPWEASLPLKTCGGNFPSANFHCISN